MCGSSQKGLLSSQRLSLSIRPRTSSRRPRLAALAAAVAAAAASHAIAASDTWVGNIDGNWNTDNSGATNWSISGNIPGALDTNNSTDIATFTGTSTNTTVAIDPNWNIDGIVFTNSATSYNIGGTVASPDTGALLLTGGGTISDASTSATTINIDAPLVIEGNSYTFTNNSTTATDGMGFTNQLSGGATGTTTLYLTGSQLSTTAHTTNDISGPIVNGSSSALSVVINMTAASGSVANDGTWCLGNSSGANTTPSTYTGQTIIENGALRVLSASGISQYTDVVLDAATIGTEITTGSTTNITVDSITAYGGGASTAAATVTTGSSGETITVINPTNPGLVLINGTNSAPTVSHGIELEGTGAMGTGGLTFIGSTNTASTSTSANFDTGTVQRTFFIGKSTATSGAPSTDFQINGTFTSDAGADPTTLGNEGIIKTGAGTLKFDNSTVAFTGTIDIQQGSLKLIGTSNNEFTNGQYDPVTIEGSTANLNLNGSTSVGNASFGAMTLTNGSITGSANNLIYAPSFNFNVAAGNTFSNGVSFADVSGGLAGGSAVSAVISNGAGVVDMSGIDSSYTGGTTVNAGTFTANGNPSSSVGVGNGTPFGTGSITLNGGILAIDPNVSAGYGAVAWSGATGSGAQFIYGGGAQINVKEGNASSLSFTIAPALTRTNHGTLVVAAGLGISNLGSTEQLFVTGGVSTKNGIVNTSIVGQNDDTNASGDFLTYNGTSGFTLATYSGITNINSGTNTTVYNAGTGSNINTLSGAASVYALNAEAQTIDTNGNTLSVGDNISGNQAGVILNGGSIISSVAGGALAFNADEGTIYTSKAGSSTTPAISANITGTGGLTLFGPGKLYLSGNNSGLTGGFFVNQGTVNITAGNNLGASGNTVTFGGGTLQFASSFSSNTPSVSNPIVLNAGGGTLDTQNGTVTIGSTISGSGQLTSIGAGSLILNAASSYTGATNINAGVLQISGSGSLGSGNVIDNASLVYNTSTSATVANVISGSGTITQAGTSTLTLTGSNQYGGATNVNAGVLKIGTSNPNALGFGAVVTAAPATAIVNSTATLDLNGNSLNKSVTLNGGALTNSSGTAAGLSSGISGYVVTSGGSGISAAAAETTGVGSGATLNVLLGLTANSVAVSSGGNYSGVPTVTISGGGGTGATATAILSGGTSGSITGFTITNAGIGYISAPTFTLSTSTQITAATLTTNGASFTAVGTQAVTPGSGYIIAPTVQMLTGTGTTITPVLNTLYVQSNSTINGAGTIQLAGPVAGSDATGTATLTLDGTSASNSISGVIGDGTGGGNLAVSKTNSTGTWNLSGANTYTGGTTVNAGTLIVSNSSGSATGSGNVTLNGGILASAANGGSISGNVVAGTGSHTIAPGGIGTVGTLAIGGLTTSSLTTLNFDLGTGSGEITNGDLLTLGSGTVSIGASTPITFNGTPTLGNDYRLIGGTISGVNVNNFSLPAAPGGESYLLSDNGVDPGYIDLVVAAGAQSLTWTDASANNLWDNGISANWNNGTSTTTFAASDTVTFSDANGGNYAVTLNTTVLPAATFFTNTNNSNNYTISGTGTLGGTGALVKSGSGTVTLSTTSIYTGGTSVSAGKLIIDRVSSTISALPNGPLTISGTGDVQLAQNLTAGSNPGPTPTSNVNITSLSITGSGDLDITNNHIIIDYTPGHDPIASIAAMVASGYNSDHWNGPGIISSNAQTNFASYGIGYADSADTGNPAGLASNQIEIAYTLLGDANLDDKVNGADFTLMAANFNDSVTAGWDKGDFNYSGTVNGDDFVLLADNFNDFASQSAVAAADLAALDSFAASNGININLTSVPEPATAAVLLTGMGILGTRRRRKAR